MHDDDEERPKHPHRNSVNQEIRSRAFHFVIKRQELTADFDERQKQLFDQALIAILVANLIPDKIELALAAARDTTISVLSGEMLADLRADTKPERSNRVQKLLNTPAGSDLDRLSPENSPRPVLLSCTRCHRYSLALRGKVVQCNDCGTTQPTLPCSTLAKRRPQSEHIDDTNTRATEISAREVNVLRSEKVQPTFSKKAEETLELLRERAQKVQGDYRAAQSSIPHFGPYPRRPNLTEAEAEAWWKSKTPMQRYVALGGCSVDDSEPTEDNIPAALVGFGVIGQQCAAVSPYLEWKNIPEKDRAIVLNCMRRGWSDLGNTAIGYPQ